MSCVHYINNTPHIILYGSRNIDRQTSQMQCWRNGTSFVIDVEYENVSGTRFGEKWLDIFGTREYWEGPVRYEAHDRWRMLCDCVLSQCLDVFEELAPDEGEYWMTLGDYLHTPGYMIRLVRDEEEELKDARGVIVSGPEWSGAYDLCPVSVEKVGNLIEELDGYRSQDLVVVQSEVNRKAAPHRVRTVEGDVFAFEPVEVEFEVDDETDYMDSSLDGIQRYLRIHNQCRGLPEGYPDGIRRVCGYATFDVVPSENGKELDRWEEKDDTQLQPHTLIAGLLLTDCPQSNILAGIVTQAERDEKCLSRIKENKGRWKAQALAIVQSLHARGMACGASRIDDWLLINQIAIHIDKEQKAWLDPHVTQFVSMENASDFESDSQKEDFEKAKELDLEGVERIFENWLPEELGKIERMTRRRTRT